jgi:threonine synthase
MDTHTAVAWSVYEKWVKESGNTDVSVVLSTASPYKFSSSVMNALGKDYENEFDAVNKLNALTGVKIPDSLVNIESKQIAHNITVEKDEMLSFVDKMVNTKIWRE